MDNRKQLLQKMHVCRFCFGGKEKNLSSIYQRDDKNVPLPVQIMSCTSIEVFPTDGLPQLICKDCKQQTVKSYIFKSNCRKVDDAFKNFLQTGELEKPEIQKIITEQKKHQHSSVQTTVEESGDSCKDESVGLKRSKLNDGSEVITVCISEGDNADSSQDTFQDTDPEDSQSNELEDALKKDDMQEVEQIDTDVFSCDVCDKTFPLQQLLDLHLPIHRRERKFACPDCDSRFFRKYDLAKHALTHLDEKPLQCSLCEKKFSRLAALRRHQMSHTDASAYMCSQCDKTFPEKSELESHVQKNHIRFKPYVCKLCTKNFLFKQGLDRHMASEHQGDKPHKCNYCSSSFSTPIRLTRHLTSHAGLRPYPCKVCRRTFLLSHHLTRHMRTHFKNENNQVVGQHKCDLCSMSFRRKDSLINHSAIHSMVNLRCVICNTSFENVNMVKDHITTHLQGLPFPCEKCEYSFDTEQQLVEHEVKHAEMEYEEQIEQEVISEANKDRYSPDVQKNVVSEDEEAADDLNESILPDQGTEESDSEVISYNISNIDDPESLTFKPSRKQRNTLRSEKPVSSPSRNEIPQEEESTVVEAQTGGNEIMYFFKSEGADSDTDVSGSVHVTGDVEGVRDIESDIKPVFRSEGTKMYQRKGPIKRKLPETRQANLIPLPEREAFWDGTTEPTIPSTASMKSLNQIATTEKPTSTRMEDRPVKVQKFIISKDEMKQMAKLGILEIRNGQVFMNTPGQPILNAKMKPIEPSDFDNLMHRKCNPQIRQYNRKAAAAIDMPSEDVSEDSFVTQL